MWDRPIFFEHTFAGLVKNIHEIKIQIKKDV